MRKLITLICCFLLMPLLCAGETLTLHEATHGKFQATMTSSNWDRYDFSHSGFSTPEAFLQYAAEKMEQMIAYGGYPNRLAQYHQNGNDIILKIQFAMTDKESKTNASSYGKHMQQGMISLKDIYFAFQMAPIVHEMTHVVYWSASRSLNEGLAQHMQDHLGGNAAVHNLGMNPHEICQNVIIPSLLHQEIVESVGTFEKAGSAANDQRAAYYIAAYSFVDYLIETYGIETYLNIHFGKDDTAYSVYTGKELEDLRRDWLSYIERYESDFTAETYRQTFYDMAIENGMPLGPAESLSQWQYGKLIN